jgi:hypothetical protein
MPVTADAFRAGAITPEHVDVLARANLRPLHTQFAAAEATMIGWAQSLCFEDFVHTVANWREAADNAAGRDRAARRHADRRLEMVPTVFGSFDLRGHGPALEGMIMRTELDRVEHHQDEPPSHAPTLPDLARPDEQLRKRRTSAAPIGRSVLASSRSTDVHQ